MSEQQSESETSRSSDSYAWQERIRARFADEEALQDGLMSPWHVRIEALRALAFQHRDAEIIEVALTEQDAPAIMDFAIKVALPSSPALVQHRLRMRKASPSADMAYFFPYGNFLYAEAAIMKRVAASPMRLQASVLKGLGLAGFTSAIPLLRRHAGATRLRTRAQALAEGDAKAARNEFGSSDSPERHWDGPSERAIAAWTALARLAAELDVPHVRTLYQQTTTLLPPPECGGIGSRSRSELAAVLYEAGALGLDEALGEQAPIGDLMISALRRGDIAAASSLAQSPRFRPPDRTFHFWPALDFAAPDYGKDQLFGFGTQKLYALSRDAGVAPPPWWQWRNAWTRSLSSRVIRGELGPTE